jgi:hypothetical protein
MFTIETIKQRFGQKKTKKLLDSYREIIYPIMSEGRKDQEKRVRTFITEAHKILKTAPATPADKITEKIVHRKTWDLLFIMAYYLYKSK